MARSFFGLLGAPGQKGKTKTRKNVQKNQKYELSFREITAIIWISRIEMSQTHLPRAGCVSAHPYITNHTEVLSKVKKKIIATLCAALMLSGVITGCSGSASSGSQARCQYRHQRQHRIRRRRQDHPERSVVGFSDAP